MARIVAILFDFGGTLDGPGNWLDRFLTRYQAAGLPLRRDELDKAYTQAARRAYDQAEALAGCGLDGLVRFLVGEQLVQLASSGEPAIRARLAAASNDALDGFIEAIGASFVAEANHALARSRRLLATLAPHFVLGVVSNWYGNLDRVLADAGLTPHLRVALDSVRVGFGKPDPRIFRAALEALSVQPERALMVGDNPIKDCAPARRLGMKAALLRGAGLEHVEFQEPPDYQIDRLDELLELDL